MQFPIWNSFAPRLHASLDLFGKGRTVVKGGWGRFDHRRLIDPEVLGANRNVQTSQTWTWHDINGNKLWDPGEVNLDPNGSDYVSTAGFSNLIPNPNELQPMQDEFTLSLEHELMPDFGVRVNGIYAKGGTISVCRTRRGRTASTPSLLRASIRDLTASSTPLTTQVVLHLLRVPDGSAGSAIQ